LLFDYLRKEQARATQHERKLQKIKNYRRTPVQIAQVNRKPLINTAEKEKSTLQRPIAQSTAQLLRPQPTLHKNITKPVAVQRKISKKHVQTEIERTKRVLYNKQKSLPPSSACAA
jgi:hypothetical protein